MADLEREYTIQEVAESLQMSERWVRARVAGGARHQRYGHKVRFTAGQVTELRDAHTQGRAMAREHSITTGRKRRRL